MLDCAKVLFSFLPDRVYFKVMQYERYIMLGLFLLVAVGGVFDDPLNACIRQVLRWLCILTGFPASILGL